jgi:hypothetical protein
VHAVQDAPASPEQVLVNWLGRGALYVGTVVERRAGLIGISYADGSREWVEASRIRPLELAQGCRVRIRFGAAEAPEIEAEVLEVRSDLIRVRMDGGQGETWVSTAMLTRVTPAGAVASAAGPAGRPGTPPVGRPAPVAPDQVRVGAVVLALYGVSRYGAEVLAVGGDGVRIRYFSDGTEALVPAERIVRVFSPPRGEIAEGTRVRYVGPGGLRIGTVQERRQDGFMRVAQRSSTQGGWIEPLRVIELVRPVEPTRLAAGTHVGVAWRGQVWGAVVIGPGPRGVRVRWNHGGREAEVPASEVVEAFSTSNIPSVSERPPPRDLSALLL